MTVLEYLNNLINSYYIENNYIKKQSIGKSIEDYCDSLEKNDFYNKKTYKIIKKMYRNFLVNTKYKIKNNYEGIDSVLKNIKDDLKYISELLEYIELEGKSTFSYDLDNLNFGTKNQFEKYIHNTKFYDMYKKQEFDLIVDSNFIDCTTLELDKKYVIILENENISSLIHELMHIYNNFSSSKFSETPSILSELSIIKEYGLSNDCERIDDILELKNIMNNNSINYIDYSIYCYGIASIIAVSFINMYGTNFKDIINVVDFIINNENIRLDQLFKYLNINDNEIIDSVNDIEKVLTYKNRQ